MSNIYLIRHGQAGTRDSYDSLSDLGRQQSRLLGQYFVSQSIRFATAYSGEMSRQRLTAQQTSAGYGGNFPQVLIDPRWNEFDLDRMYREIAPQLCAGSPDFRREYEAMRRQLEASCETQGASVHRRWLPCDTKLVEAWIAGEHHYDGESWQEFHERICGCRNTLISAERHENIAIFTSATPIAIWIGLALGVPDGRVMKLAGVLHNSSFSVLQFRDDHLRVFNFNATPHLISPNLRTFR